MRRAIMLLCILSLAGCDAHEAAPPQVNSTGAASTAPAEPSLPKIIIDSVHAVHESQLSGKPYLVDAGGGIILDGTKFAFQANRDGRTPNVVQVLYEQSQYVADWPAKGNGVATLDASSLRVLNGQPFAGFVAGKQAFVAVGYRPTTAPSAAHPTVFSPFWVGSIIFR